MAWKVVDGVTLNQVIRTARDNIGNEWTTLARGGFEMTKTEIDAIKHDYRDNLVEQIAQCFALWERQKGKAATAQAFVDCVLKELPNSQLVLNLKRNGFIERRGLGGSITTSSPTQSRTSFTSLEALPSNVVPVQESLPDDVVPVQESSLRSIKPPLLGLKETGVDDVEKDTADPSVDENRLGAEQSCVDEAADDDRRMKKIRNLKKRCHRKTGEGPFDKDSMISVEQGFGVVKTIFLVGDTTLMAGIELESHIQSGGNGTYEGKSFFECEDGFGLFLPYEELHADPRFGDIPDETVAAPLDTDSSIVHEDSVNSYESSIVEEPNIQIPLNLAHLRFSDTSDVLCNYPGCNKSKCKDIVSGKMYDYCGKSHAEAHQRLLSGNESVSISSQGPTCVRFVIPEDCAGLVIGKGGKNIQKVESSTNTIIKMCSTSVGGKAEGFITGSKENCNRAAIEIMECIQEKRAMHTAATRKITVPNNEVGRVIGKGGNTIRYIKAVSGARDIEIEKATGFELIDPSYPRTCTIIGSDEQVEKAIKLIRQAQNGEDILINARLAAMFASLGFQIKDDSDTVHTPSADQCTIS